MLKLKKPMLLSKDSYFLGNANIEKGLVSKRFLLVKETTNTLLVTFTNQARGSFLVEWLSIGIIIRIL